VTKADSIVLGTIPDPKLPFAISAGLYLYAKYRDELRVFSAESVVDRLAFFCWWEQFGAASYPGLEWPIRTNERSYLERLTADKFNSEYEAAVIWWLKGSHTSYLEGVGLLSRDELKKTAEIVNGEFSCRLPTFIKLIWKTRDDLRETFDLKSGHSVLNLIRWWGERGFKEYPRIEWDSINETLLYLKSKFGEIPNRSLCVPWFLELIHEGRSDLTTAFDIKTPEGISGLIKWWGEHGIREYPFWSYPLIRNDTFFRSSFRGLEVKDVGINLIGFPYGVLGLGEDLRLAKLACESALIPHKVIEAPISGPERLDNSLVGNLGSAVSHSISLFCLPPTDMGRMIAEGGTQLIENIAYGIGAWPWELPHWPREIRVDGLVDEIWAQSNFVANAFQIFTNLPVTLMPHTVQTLEPRNISKEVFGFKGNSFLFLIMFDSNSWLTRKNPIGSIEAYIKAFPLASSGVGLLIKAMNLKAQDPQWKKILDLINGRDDIKVINQTMSRQDAVDLIAMVDGYIALHRSEGFGRIIAESMLLGKPVVVSNYSGNIDFCKENNSYLVSGSLIPLSQEDYIFWEGQHWFDPNIYDASQKILDLYEDSEKRKKISESGRMFIKENYSAETIGRRYNARINSILKNIG
jgi:glycosyltransferase involved in cell wall biosynthesis